MFRSQLLLLYEKVVNDDQPGGQPLGPAHVGLLRCIVITQPQQRASVYPCIGVRGFNKTGEPF